jgi:TRAP-type C4-dicarboxylate transport system permease small subunit
MPSSSVRVAERIVLLADVLAGAVTVGIFVVMAAQVVSRYVFNSSLFWADELAVWGLGWLVMLACVGLAWHGRHVQVPMVLLATPLRVRVPLIVLSKVLTVAFLLLLAWYGWQVFDAGFHRRSPGLGISTRWLKLAIPVSASLMALVVAIATAHDLAAWRRGDRSRFERWGREELSG